MMTRTGRFPAVTEPPQRSWFCLVAVLTQQHASTFTGSFIDPYVPFMSNTGNLQEPRSGAPRNESQRTTIFLYTYDGLRSPASNPKAKFGAVMLSSY